MILEIISCMDVNKARVTWISFEEKNWLDLEVKSGLIWLSQHKFPIWTIYVSLIEHQKPDVVFRQGIFIEDKKVIQRCLKGSRLVFNLVKIL